MPLGRLQIVIRLLALALTLWVGNSSAQDSKLQIKIEGIEKDLVKNVEAYLSVEKLKGAQDWNENALRRAHRRATKEIRAALEPYGYYSPEVETSLKQIDDRWIATYQINPGPATIVKEVVIELEGEGRDDPVLKKLIDEFPLKPGDTLDHSQYEAGKRAFVRHALDNGFLDARVGVHEIAVDRGASSARIALDVDTGPLYRFGDIRFEQDVIDEDLLYRFVPFKSGDPLSNEALLDFHNGLYDSEYFGSVDIKTDREHAQDFRVPITATLEPLPRHRYTAGLGYGTDTGPRASLGWTNRRLNRRGHRLSTLLKVSDVKDSFTTAYIVPIRNPRTDKLQYSISWIDDVSGDKEDESFVYEVSRSIALNNGWVETISLQYRTDSYIIGEDTGNTEFLIPGIGWSRIEAEKATFATKGYRFGIDFRGANDHIIADGTFIQTIINAKLLVGLTLNSRLILRGDVGTTVFGDVQRLPPALRFFAGGDNSVRGYEYESLSPNGEGGEQLLVGSAEFEYRFRPNWSAAVFYDAGNAMNEWSDSLKKSVGIGIRWYTPVGPLRVDCAEALDEEETPQRWHIVLGPVL